MDDRAPTSGEDHEVPAILSKDIVLLPHAEMSIIVTERKGLAAISQALREHNLVAFIPSDSLERGTIIGTLCLIENGESTTDGLRVYLKGLWRINVESLPSEGSNPKVRFDRAEEEISDSALSEKDPTMRKVFSQIDEFTTLLPQIPVEIVTLLKGAKSSGELADLCGLSPTFTNEERLDLLRTLDPHERLTKVYEHFDSQLDALKKTGDVKPITECEVCSDLADRAFEADSSNMGEIVVEFLNHVVTVHTGEILNLLAEKYGPSFMKKRALR